jgi:subtilisin family serine protease
MFEFTCKTSGNRSELTCGVFQERGPVDTSFQMNLAAIARKRTARQAALLTAAMVCALLPNAGRAVAQTGEDEANLSPRLEELASPDVRRAPRAAQAARLGLPTSGPGSLLRSGGKVLVNVRFDRGAAAGVDDLEAAGAEVVEASPAYQTITVNAKPVDLPELADVRGVGGITEVLAPIVRGAVCGGSVSSEGDAQLRATSARAKWGVDGSGVTVGVLSDSFNHAPGAATHAAGDVASGDLPGPGSPCGSQAPVGILSDPFIATDEGRAMAQIVHDLAPGTAIDFATAVSGEFAFANNIRGLANAGARVIADDVTYPEEPFFQDGPVAQAVNEVTAAGVSYFSAAGNDNLIDEEGRDIASWEAPAYRDSGSCPAAVVLLSEEIEEAEEEAELTPEGLNPTHCVNFDPGTGEDLAFGITVEAEETLKIDLQWAESWFGVGTDLDAFLLDDEEKLLEPEVEGEPIPVVSLEDNIGVSERPFEFLAWTNPGPEEEVRLVINRFAGATPRLKFALLENGGGVSAIEHPVSTESDVVGPTVFGHSGAESAVGVGAVRFDDSTEPEGFSSRGPVKHFFGPVTGASPAAATGEQFIPKPDLVATDCGATTFFSFFVGVWRFCGTSAAAPHAAAVAALVRQANPGANAEQVQAALVGTARPVGAFGSDAVGAGLIDADAAVNLLALPPQVAITRAPPPLSRERRPTIEFAASRPVGFSCSVDGGVPQPCASPFTVPVELGDGQHSIGVTGTDLGGRTGGGSVSFRIDGTAPQTSIAAHPRKVVRTHRRRVKAAFRFSSNEGDVTFSCAVDREAARVCPPRFSRRYALGKHVVRVNAQDAAGNLDTTAAVFRFRVKRAG